MDRTGEPHFHVQPAYDAAEFGMYEAGERGHSMYLNDYETPPLPRGSGGGRSRGRGRGTPISSGGGGRGSRHSALRPKDSVGMAVWAKLARFPWWPAQILAENDPFIPPGSEPPRIGAVPVRFFGTYEFAWIESQRALAPFADDDRVSKSFEPDFMEGVREAKKFQQDGTLPIGFELALHEQDVPPPPKARGRKSKACLTHISYSRTLLHICSLHTQTHPRTNGHWLNLNSFWNAERWGLLCKT
eukprot:jgi/Botrbrau1/4875/Bobra.0032s0031.1